MDEFKFNSINELYNRLLPAMETKKNDLLRNTKVLISEKEIWGYLRYNYWNKKSKLTLGEMVNDILSTPDHELIDYHNLNTK
ncbi:MAG: post-transcriptional regulator [Tenericutes bacterium]|nr:post-transcriptional regulator [Mycoplasmatota bacterium]MDO4341737.1 post-transcriptional regulator [bacterium]